MGYNPKIYKSEGGDKLTVASGGTLLVESGATLTIDDGALEPADLTLAQGSVLVGNASAEAAALVAKTTTQILIGNGTTITSAALSGDVTMDNAGEVTIAAKAVEDTMISAAAGTVLVGTKTSVDVSQLDNSAAGSIVIGAGAGETCIAAALTGDVSMSATGATTLVSPVVKNLRGRVTASQINAGATLLAAIPGYTYRMVDCKAIAYGGAVGDVTTVDILTTEGAGSVKLVAFAQASLTQSTVLTAGGSGAAVLADGASYIVSDANVPVTILKNGSDVVTATGVDIILTYTIEAE